MNARPTSATSATPGAPTRRARRQWSDLPDQARAAVEQRTGSVTATRSAGVGLTSGIAATIATAGAVFFVKAAPAAAPVAHHYQRERVANEALPESVPAPRMLWAGTVAHWHVLLFEYAPGHVADLAPGSPDLGPVAAAVTALHTPCRWPGAPSAALKAAALLNGARPLLDAPPAHLAHCVTLAKRLQPGDLAGQWLVHADLHADNLLVDEKAARIIDWSLACTGAPWVDIALLLPRLIDAGHTPSSAAAAATSVPAWRDAPADAVDALCAARALFATRMADTGPPLLAAKRRRTAAACLAWVERDAG